MHRDLHGDKADHALVSCTWKWRIRTTKRTPCKDYDCLYAQTSDEQGNPTPNEYMIKFEQAVSSKLDELGYDEKANNATELYSHTCDQQSIMP